MPNAATTETIRATLPTVAGAIDEIAIRFYRGLFAAHPELERDLFNRGNQASGAQQRALAGAVVGYAASVTAPDAPDPTTLVTHIAHRHASLGVTAAQYAVVHDHLMGAVAEVLGDAATLRVAEAWSALYWELAGLLVGAEHDLYAAAGVADGDVWRTLAVVGREDVAEDTVALTLAAPDGSPAPGHRPGQYVSVQVPVADGADQIRQYSLSASGRDGTERITVRRVTGTGTAPDGEVSAALIDDVAVGDTIRVSLPFGDAVLPDGDAPVVLVTAGIGVTPALGILDALAAAGSDRRVTVSHSDRSPARHAHRAELERLVAALPNGDLRVRYSETGAALDVTAAGVPGDATAIVCGPPPFAAAAAAQLRAAGLESWRIRVDTFGPDDRRGSVVPG